MFTALEAAILGPAFSRNILEITAALFGAAPLQASWTVPTDGVISDVGIDCSAGTAVISNDPQFDISTFASANSVTDQLIAGMVSTGAGLPVFRPGPRPALSGESIYFSADSYACFHLTFTPSAE